MITFQRWFLKGLHLNLCHCIVNLSFLFKLQISSRIQALFRVYCYKCLSNDPNCLCHLFNWKNQKFNSKNDKFYKWACHLKKNFFRKCFVQETKMKTTLKHILRKKNIAKKASEMKSNKNCSVITKCVLKREEMIWNKKNFPIAIWY